MKQGAVTGIPVLQSGSFWSDGFSLAFLPAVLFSGSICKSRAGLGRSEPFPGAV